MLGPNKGISKNSNMELTGLKRDKKSVIQSLSK